MANGRFFLLESGRPLDMANEFMRQRRETLEVVMQWVQKYGGNDAVYASGDTKPIGIDVCPDPDVWEKDRRHEFWTPRKNKSGNDVLAEIEALPEDPTVNHHWYGCANASAVIGWDPGPLKHAQFIVNNDSIAIFVPAFAAFNIPVDESEIDRLAQFVPPDGCREITEFEWKRICRSNV